MHNPNIINETERWLPRLGRVAAPRLRLIAFPFAGGSAASFAAWPGLLPEDVELRAVQLPGRGVRINEAPQSRIVELRAGLVDALLPLCDLPIVFFGHSNGALLAYDIALHIPASVRDCLQRVVISAKPAPHRQPALNWHNLDDDALTKELIRLGGTPQELLTNAEFMQILLPLMRADFALSATYQLPAMPVPLTTPVALWWGSDDRLAREQDVLAWRNYCTAVDHTYAFPGEHFYINDQRRAVIAQLTQWL